MISTSTSLASGEYVTIKKMEKDPANGKPSYPVAITAEGRKFFKKLEKKKE